MALLGRDHELDDVDRRLHAGRLVTLIGPGGVGKTALAAEFARWMVRSQQMHRAAFRLR